MSAGTPVFNVLRLDALEISNILQPYLINGFNTNRLTIADLTTDIMPALPPNVNEDVAVLVAHGMPIFDAIARMTLLPNRRPALTVVNALPNNRTNNILHVAEALAYLFFFLMTRANIPSGDYANNNADIPNFLRQFLGLQLARDVYMDRIASFNLSLIEHNWIMFVNIVQLPNQVRNRLSLGIAGYRMFAPFRLYNCQADVPNEVFTAYTVVRTYVNSGVSWDIHPITRDMTLLTRTGPLNANLGNLILLCFTQADIQEMVQLRILFQVPIRDPRAMHWRTWDDTTFGPIDHQIAL